MNRTARNAGVVITFAILYVLLRSKTATEMFEVLSEEANTLLAYI